MFNSTRSPAALDDNAVSVVEFENKALAVLETSFISPWQADCFELLGTEGAMIRVGNEVKVRSKKFGIDGWVILDKLPKGLPSAMSMWFDGIENGAPIPFDTGRGEALSELLEKAYISDREQRIVKF